MASTDDTTATTGTSGSDSTTKEDTPTVTTENKENADEKKDTSNAVEEPPELKEPILFDCSTFGHAKMVALANGTYQDRIKASMPASDVTPALALSQTPMTFWEDFVATAFSAFGVPVAVFNIPIALFVIGKFLVGNVALTFQLFGLFVILPLALMPQKFNPDSLQSWLALTMLKYYSWRLLLEEFPSPNRPRILVGPPHGVFPYGCLMTMICYPSTAGIFCRGLAARAAVVTPIFKQILRTVGIVDANRDTARRVLEKPSCLGISTGGVAEIFETNADDEVILLKERVGLIKLAIRTGADLQPCYIYGSNDVLSCWTGEGIPGANALLSRISRKLGFGVIVIFGRFGLPIPRRVPLLGVCGKAIRTDHMKCENPTKEQIEEVQGLLIKHMEAVFQRYKKLYKFDEKHLIIK
ncbi:Diacylglycerol O-acyltransferase 2 [Seminavis robusta]|uniref:Acyltransferase n=1 Tax=Seminavis robusta TaxID=568900 RepID=A0A9N8E2P6_9STRA|nr:Diacylglycerol O-acyltransferase 2 [Seminavis robusta]|eukprot:Sro495_g154450.1 Diacylglycerol O-acyltransferase 2 (412) ;mRNA; f:24912-26300